MKFRKEYFFVPILLMSVVGISNHNTNDDKGSQELRSLFRSDVNAESEYVVISNENIELKKKGKLGRFYRCISVFDLFRNTFRHTVTTVDTSSKVTIQDRGSFELEIGGRLALKFQTIKGEAYKMFYVSDGRSTMMAINCPISYLNTNVGD
ncbi:hypothetical protein C9J41_17235 [Photobacterium sp. GB-50]|uniref:hypothetical protein n=1 Tax=Photobacterium sp. GB-50 TaxID=2022107 RepID=UPI000D4A283A|nr:hypothetical protein [Photobacterium sp. GB-50]PSW72349.1 hypothetical protein C9J41_17235 [Photobacterium sp. GB-50]